MTKKAMMKKGIWRKKGGSLIPTNVNANVDENDRGQTSQLSPQAARRLPSPQQSDSYHMSPLRQVSAQSQGQSSQEQQQRDSQPEVYLTYRQKRRLEQAKRNGPKRGRTRGLKYKELEGKPLAKITDDMRRIIGEHADRFICDASLWVKECCPLNSWNWARMDPTAKDRLKAKLKEKYDLPSIVDGQNVDVALEFQCKSLYRGWRYRLKEALYVGFTKEEAEANKPSNIDADVWRWLVYEFWPHPRTEETSRKNRGNRLCQKIRPANGALSTARILYNMVMSPPVAPCEEEADNLDRFAQEEDPIYLKLYERLKRHKDGSWEPEAYEKYVELQKIHVTQIAENSVDNLTVREAFAMVHEEKSGYVSGLGPGPRPLRKSGVETRELRAEIEALQQSQLAREAVLSKQIEVLKASNDELRSSNKALMTANSDMRADLEQIRAEQIEREQKLREEIMLFLNSGHRCP